MTTTGVVEKICRYYRACYGLLRAFRVVLAPLLAVFLLVGIFWKLQSDEKKQQAQFTQQEQAEKKAAEEKAKEQAREDLAYEQRAEPVRNFIKTVTRKTTDAKQDRRARFLKSSPGLLIPNSDVPCSLIEKTLGPADHKEDKRRESGLMETTFTYNLPKGETASFTCWFPSSTNPFIYSISFEGEFISAWQWSLSSPPPKAGSTTPGKVPTQTSPIR